MEQTFTIDCIVEISYVDIKAKSPKEAMNYAIKALQVNYLTAEKLSVADVWEKQADGKYNNVTYLA